MTLRLVALVGLAFAVGCTGRRPETRVAPTQNLEGRVAALDAEVARLRVRHDSLMMESDSLRQMATELRGTIRERDELIRALRLELQRLKDIDLRPRAGVTPAPAPRS